MSIEICDENGTRLSILGFDCCWQMEAGEQYQFRYHIANQSGNPEVEWTVNDHTVLHVDPNGCVTAMMAGSAELTVKIKGSTIAHQKCSLTIQVSGSDPDAVIFNTLRIDDAKASDARARQWLSSLNLPSDVVVRYFMGDIRHFEIQPIKNEVSNAWAAKSIYGTNAGLFGGYKTFAAAHIYDGVSLQVNQFNSTSFLSNKDNYPFLNGGEKDTNNPEPEKESLYPDIIVGRYGLLTFTWKNEDKTELYANIFTNAYTLSDIPAEDRAAYNIAVGNTYFAIGGMDLFGSGNLNESAFVRKFNSAYGSCGDPFYPSPKRHRTVIGYNSSTEKIILAVIYREGDQNIDYQSKQFINYYDQVNLFQTRQIMKYLHCDMILNLDGGTSSCISFKHKDGQNDYLKCKKIMWKEESILSQGTMIILYGQNSQIKAGISPLLF